VRPHPAGWGPVASRVPVHSEDRLGVALLDWVAGLGLIYGTLFGIGKLVLGTAAEGIAWLALAAVCGGVIARSLRAPGRTVQTAPLVRTPGASD